jgi:hypothetical protein
LSIPGFNVTPIHTVTNDIVFFSDHIPWGWDIMLLQLKQMSAK